MRLLAQLMSLDLSHEKLRMKTHIFRVRERKRDRLSDKGTQLMEMI